MIARVALLRRLPRRIDYLDYDLPQSLKVRRGDLVRVPFRSGEEYGIVLSVDNLKSRERRRAVAAIEEKRFISDQCLRAFELTAKNLVQSVATVLYTAFPSINGDDAAPPFCTESLPLIVRRQEVPHIQAAVKLIGRSKSCFIETADIVQAAAIIAAASRGADYPLLVLLPHVHDLKMLASVLSSKRQVCLLDSSLPLKERRDLARHWKAKKILLLLATRLGSLLCPPAGLTFVVRSGSPEHVSYDRNPRYDARELVRGRSKLVLLDSSPKVADIKNFPSLLTLPAGFLPQATVVNLRQERQVGFEHYLTEPLKKAIGDCLQSGKKVLLFYNRKAVPEGQKGTSNASIEDDLKKFFPAVPVQRVEKGSLIKSEAKTGIILATQFYLQAVYNPWLERFGLVAELCADLGLSSATLKTVERAVGRLKELQGIALRQRANFLVQAWDVALIGRMLDDHLALLQEELSWRERLRLPPFALHLRLKRRGAKAEERIISQDEFESQYAELKNLPDEVIIEINPEKI